MTDVTKPGKVSWDVDLGHHDLDFGFGTYIQGTAAAKFEVQTHRVKTI